MRSLAPFVLRIETILIVMRLYSTVRSRLKTKVSLLVFSFNVRHKNVTNMLIVKWESIEPEPNQFNFGPADEIVSTAQSLGAKVRGHNFMWQVNQTRHQLR